MSKRTTFKFKKCTHCDEDQLVEVTATEFQCRYCNGNNIIEQVVEQPKLGTPGIGYGYSRLKPSREFTEGIVDKVMNQKGVNQANRKF